jgi:hypothetical protein
MRLQEELLARHSKDTTTKIVKWIGSEQSRFDELFKIFLGKDEVLARRAAWALSYSAIAQPELILKHAGKLLANLHRPNLHTAIKRNTMRLLQDLRLPEKYHGELMNTCFKYITSPTELPAVKAFSLTVLQNLSREYPDIIPEIKTVIESQWDNESAAFRTRAKKLLRSL